MGGDRQVTTGSHGQRREELLVLFVRKKSKKVAEGLPGRPAAARCFSGPDAHGAHRRGAAAHRRESAPPQPQPPAGPFFVVPYAVPIPGQPNAAPPPPQGLIPSPGGVVPPGYVVRQMPQGYYVATPPNLAYAPGSPNGGATLGSPVAAAALGSPVAAPVAAALGPWGGARSSRQPRNRRPNMCKLLFLSQLVEGPVLRFI